jgi:nicotinamidase-related amidase
MAPSCLIVVDVQKGFVNAATAAIPATVEALQRRFDLVAVTRFVNPPGSAFRRLLDWPRFAPGSTETELAFQARADALVLDKAAYSALDERLKAWLGAEGVETVHLAGIATDNCVLKTAVDLFDGGWRPVVLEDCCASHGGPDCHEAGLLLLRRFIGARQLAPGAAAPVA